MLFKIVLLIVILIIVYIIFFKRKSNTNNKSLKDTQECTKCKTFVTHEDAIVKNDKIFCSVECLA